MHKIGWALCAVIIATACVAHAAPVRLGDGALPCKLEAGEQTDVVHMQVGVDSHPVCDSVFYPETDTAVRVTRGTLEAPVQTETIPNFMKEHRGLKYFSPIDKSVFKTPPSGWCSWYYYYRNLDEAEAVKNLEWMAENLVPFGATYFQIDDIWQLRGDDDAQWWRDWNGVYEDRFPHGMKWLAERIHEKGMKAGIWLACFGQTNSEFAKSRPELWLVDDKGEYVDAGWVGRYLCDPSSKAAQEYLNQLFTKLAEDWDYDYFKIDGQPTVVSILRNHQKTLKNPDIPADDAYRLGLEAIKSAIGPERFLLGCWGTPVEGIGIMNGSRTGGDVAANWSGFSPALSCTMRWYFTHNTAWYADPDTLLVRPPLTLDQARAWASLYGLTGQLLMTSDKMYELPPDRVEILKRVLPPADIKPMCLYPYDPWPHVWHLAARVPGLNRDVVGLLNWEDKTNMIELNFSDLDPGLGDNKPVALYDFWNARYLGRFEGGVKLAQRPTSCEVLSVCAVTQRPELISTSRHITQGAIDLKHVDWEANKLAWSGTSECVAGDPYTLTFLLDTTSGPVWEATGANTSGPTPVIQAEWPLARVTFTPTESGEVAWRVTFRRATRVPERPASKVAALAVEATHWKRAELFWPAARGASRYELYRNGKYLGMTFGTSYIDSDLAPSTDYAYTVTAVSASGMAGPTSATVTARTLDLPQRPAKPDVYVTDLKPRSVSEGWRATNFDKSIEGNKLRIADETFDHGIGTHAHSEIVYDIAGKGYKHFVALVGIDREISAPEGTCAFQVFVDGRKKFDSDVLGARDEPMGVQVDITGAKTLKLVATDGGDGINYDHANWAEAGFLK